MKSRGVSLITVIVTILILAIIVVVAVLLVRNFLNKTTDDEIEYSKAEVLRCLDKIVDDKFMSAYAEIQSTQKDLSTEFNEKDMISYLTATDNYEGETCFMVPDASFDEPTINDVMDSDFLIYPVYILDVNAVLDDDSRYGIGESKEEGDVYTLEVILSDDSNDNLVSTGEYNLIYTDVDGTEEILGSVYLYRTNET